MKLLTRMAVRILVLAGLLVPCSQGVFARQTPNQSPPAGDNTKMNQGDGSGNASTADQQKENPTDRELTQHIRKAIVQDQTLSTYAHNVKIITQNGTVTLKGPVRSEGEKAAVEAKAAEAAGKDRVVNDLTVVSDQK